MSEDSEIGKRQIEGMVLDQVLDVLPLITGRTVCDEWDDTDATQIEGSPDHIIGLDGRALGIELTEFAGLATHGTTPPRPIVSRRRRARVTSGAGFSGFRLRW